MDFVETEGDNIDAAIENALKALGVGREKITVDIISEGRKGILGFGAQKAKIRASLRKLNLESDLAPAQPQHLEGSARTAENSARPPERDSGGRLARRAQLQQRARFATRLGRAAQLLPEMTQQRVQQPEPARVPAELRRDLL